jgi:hypothetical protein
MRIASRSLAVCLSLVGFPAGAAPVAAAQNPEVLLHQDFEDQLGGWSTVGPGASLHLVNGPAQAHAGHGALAFSYELKPRQVSAAVLPATGELARMQGLRFWLKIDHASAVAVLLSERKPEGGNYTAWVWAQANVWQQVRLTPSDFILSDGPNDPKDADGKLDLDQLQGIGVFDLAAFFPTLSAAGPDHSVTHTLWIDDFEAIAGAPAVAAGMRIDGFDRGMLGWIPTAGAELKLVAGAENPLREPAMLASYEQTEAPFPSFVRRLGNFDLSKATRLEFDIASEKEGTIAIGLELKKPGAAQGPRFNLPIYPPGEREVFHVSIKLEDFEGAGKLDPAQLKTLILTDASAAGNGNSGKNTIWIGNLEFR